MIRKITTAALCAAFLASPVLAETSTPLAAGKPAGTKEAALAGNSFLFFVIGGAAIVGLAVVAGNSGGHGSSTSSTGTSS